jgi:hypothetical protein
MAATLTLRVYTGNQPGTQSSAVTGIDFISADNATNTLANRQANPITVGTRSYEKWLALRVDTSPSNSVANFKIWGDGAVMASSTLWFTAGLTTYSTATSASSSWANTSFNGFTANYKATWDTGWYYTVGSVTKFVVFQLEIGSDASPGNWTQETINYSYDET